MNRALDCFPWKERNSAGGERCAGELRVRDAVLNWLQIGAPEVDQEMRQVEVNRTEKKGRTKAHR
jgi:hypothetical protein